MHESSRYREHYVGTLTRFCLEKTQLHPSKSKKTVKYLKAIININLIMNSITNEEIIFMETPRHTAVPTELKWPPFGLVNKLTSIVNTQQARQTKIKGAHAYKLARFDNLCTYFAVTVLY